MTRLEERLRNDLPALADALIRDAARPSQETAGVSTALDRAEPWGRRRLSRRAVLVGAVGAAASAVIAIETDLFRSSGRGTRLEAVGSSAPRDFGSWAVMAEAPMEPRPYAVAAWTGSRAVFWAGSSLSRGFAYTDGALYDPATNTWESMAVPGWGHPGLTSAFFDGELYALAKGGGTRFDPIGGEWRDLPPVDGMYLAATVATDDGIWGLGPADLNPTGQPDLAIARYLASEDTWAHGPIWEGTADQAGIVAELSRLESTALWTGTEIGVCGPTGECIGFDPDTEIWRSIPPPRDAEASAVAVATDLGLTMLVRTESDNSAVAVVVLTEQGWSQQVTGIPAGGLDTLTAAAAGDWLAIFGSGQPPILVHLPSGVWRVESDGPLGGVVAPNTVWTGDQLVVWGGVADDLSSAAGAVWTAPTA